MKFNQWTLALASVGIVSLGSVAQAEEQHSVMTALSSTTLSGYVDTSASWWVGSQNKNGANLGLPGRSFDGMDKQDGFNLNAVKLSLEKALGDATEWSAGYKTDLIFGPDATAYNAVLNGGGLSGNADEFSIKQAYVALRAPIGNGLDIKMGVWDTIIGYEYFDASSNPNYSRSYGFFLEPLHHTGLLASYKVTDIVSLTGGIANAQGLGTAINDKNYIESNKSYLGSLAITLPEGAGSFQNSVIALGVVHGRYGRNQFGGGAQTKSVDNLYAGVTLNTPVEGLTVGFAWDYLKDAAGISGAPSSDAYALAAYIGFGQDKWKLNFRADYLQSSDGVAIAALGGDGDRDELGSLTGTFEYSLWENVLSRLEVRYDKDLGGERPFGDGDEQAITVTANAVYKF